MISKRLIDWPFVGLFVAALLFRIFLMGFRYAIGWDEPHYLDLAACFASGNITGWLHPFWSPLYPALAGLLSIPVPNLELAGRLTNVLLGTLLLVPIYPLGRELFGRQSALWAAAALAFFPPLAFASTTTLAEPAYMLFAYLGVWLGWQAISRNSILRALLAGVFFGLSYLARPEGVGYLIVYCLFAGVMIVRGFLFHQQEKETLKLATVAAVMWVLVASPYLFYLRSETGRWTLSAKAEANQQLEAQYFSPGKLGTFDSLSDDNRTYAIDQIYHDGNFIRSAENNGTFPIKNSLGVLATKYATHFYRLSRSEIAATFSLGLIVLFALGLFGARWVSSQVRLTFYLLSYLGFFWFVVVPLFHINERYLAALLPMAMIWVGHGIVILKNWFVDTANGLNLSRFFDKLWVNRLSWAGAVSFVIVFSFLPQLGSVVKRTKWDAGFWQDAVELKLAGQWLRQHTDSVPVLLSHNKAVNFYAGNFNIRSGASFSQDEWPRIGEYARYRGVTHVVWDERYAAIFPKLGALANPSTAPPELTVIYDESPAPSLRTIIYRLDAAKLSGIESRN